MTNAIRVLIVVLTGLVAWLGAPGRSGADVRDLDSGLAYLRAGSQTQAEEHLTKYRDQERDPEIRNRISRILPLLGRPLSPEVREYIASTLQEATRRRLESMPDNGPPSRYLSRSFPVFP
jgi:hypothetical protein